MFLRRPVAPLVLVLLLASLSGPGSGPAPTSTDLGGSAPPPATAVREIDVPDVARTARGPAVVADTGRRTVAPFAMVGLTWAPGSAAGELEVEVRVRREGSWTPWQHLPAHDDGGRRPGTEPLWVRDADAVQARVLSSSHAPGDLELSLVGHPTPGGLARPASSDGTARLTPVARTVPQAAVLPRTAAAPAMPTVVSRAAWGVDESSESTCDAGTYSETVRAAFVHHTAGTNDYTSAESAQIVRDIHAFHTQSRGFCDIGYNALVDRFGTVFEGRRGGLDLPVIGAHAGGHNLDSFGVALMGNFEQDPPPAATTDAAAGLLAWKLASNYRDPEGYDSVGGETVPVISGHRDVSATLCPGQYTYDDLPALRQAVADRIAPYDSPIYRTWQRLGGEAGFVGSPFRGETGSGDATYAEFTGADLWWSRDTGTHEVHGPIRRRYRRFSARDDRLGVPTSNQRTGQAAGARFNVFEGGRIYFSRETRAHVLYGPVLRRYLRLGGDGARLALPTTDVRPGHDPRWRYAVFQGGRVYWSKATGPRQVWGRFLRRYLRLGGDGSALGLPTTGQRKVRNGAVQRFQGGRMRWYRSTKRLRVFYR